MLLPSEGKTQYLMILYVLFLCRPEEATKQGKKFAYVATAAM